MTPCVFKNCPLCKERDDFINQLNIELMQDMLTLTQEQEPVSEDFPLTQDLDLDFMWDIENENINFD